MSVDRPSVQAQQWNSKAGIRDLIEQAASGEEYVIASAGKLTARLHSTASAGFQRTFLDTNILLYAEDGSHPVKQKKAVEVILELRRRRSGAVSYQVLQEFFANATRKLKLDAGIARDRYLLDSGNPKM